MRKLTILFIYFCFIFIGTAHAENMSGLLVSEGRVTGFLDTSYGYQMQVDMPIPEDRREYVKQLKMESLMMTRNQVKELLSGYVLTSVADAEWVFEGTAGSEQMFHFQEESMLYMVPLWYKKACPLDENSAPDSLLAADATVRAIMDDIGIAYEYPFYMVADCFSTLDTQTSPLNIQNRDDVAQIFLGGEIADGTNLYNYYAARKAFVDDYVYVLVRLQADGIPFAYGDIRSPSYQDKKPMINSGVYVQFQLTSDGRVTYADAGNIQTVIKAAAETRPLLAWTDCLEQLCTVSNGTISKVKEASLIRTELCYAINQNHVTYPVWEFTIEISYGENEFPYERYPFTFYVDAITGECL